jgi:hypothetical protein
VANASSKRLRVGYKLADEQKLYGGLDVMLDGFDIQYVPISNFDTVGQNSSGHWCRVLSGNT